MGNYSDDSDSVRVDFFKESGKWYCTEAVKWTGEYNSGITDNEFAVSLRNHLRRGDGSYRLADMTAVCLEPYHQNAYPLMMRVADAVRAS